jgi:hypothetical protein
LVLVALTAARVSWTSAALSAPGAEAERTQLYKEARKLGEANQWAEARDKLERVVEIRSAPKALIALAFAELQLGNLLKARTLYRRALDDARAGALEDDVRAAQAGMEHVQKRIPKLELVLPDEVAAHEVRVAVDRKRVLFRAGVVEVDPGEHVVVVAALGRVPFRAQVTIAESEHQELRVAFREESGASQPAAGDGVEQEPESASSGSLPIGPIVLGGAGAITATVGAVLWIGGNSDYQAVVDECGGDGSSCPTDKRDTLEPRADDARSKITTGQTVVGVGAVLMVSAGIWWALSASGPTPEPPEARHALRWTAGWTPRGLAVGVDGRW